MFAELLIFSLDMIGIAVCAFEGVSKGAHKRLDIFGLLLVGVVSALAGGIIRDLLLARTPYAVSNPDYLLFAGAASIISILLYRVKLGAPHGLLPFADALGLGAFSAAGAAVAVAANLSILHAILLAIVTAVGGGMLRDVLVNEVPFILKREIYATAAGLGGALFYVSVSMGLDLASASVLCITVVSMLRVYAVKTHMNLPVL